jgi:hypothetical protein
MRGLPDELVFLPSIHITYICLGLENLDGFIYLVGRKFDVHGSWLDYSSAELGQYTDANKS